MPIPVIPKRQGTALTPAPAAQFLTVQAPTALLAPFEALGQTGQVVSQIGNAWHDKELKMQLATEVATAEARVDLDIEQTWVEVEKSLATHTPNYTAEDASAAFQHAMKAKIGLITSGGVPGITFSTNNARRTFSSGVAGKLATKHVAIRKYARARQTSRAVALSEINIDNWEREIAGIVPVMDVVTGLPVKSAKRVALESQISKSLSNLVNINYLTWEQGYDRLKGSQERIARLQIDREMLTAAEHKNAEGYPDETLAHELSARLFDPAMFPNLAPVDRQNAQEATSKLASRLERLANAQAARERAATAAARKIKHDKNYIETADLIFRAKNNTLGPDEVAPNFIDLQKLARTDEIGASEHADLIRFLEDPMAGRGRNVDWLGEQFVRIANAESEEDIDRLVAESYHQLSIGAINMNDVSMILNHGKSQKSSTPSAKRAKAFGNVLDGLTKIGGVADIMLGIVKGRAVFINERFWSDYNAGVPPLQAFNDAVESYTSSATIELKHLPTEVRGINDLKNKKVTEWTVEDIAQARTEVKTTFSGKPSQLGIEWTAIEFIETWLEQQQKIDKVLLSDEMQEMIDRNPASTGEVPDLPAIINND